MRTIKLQPITGKYLQTTVNGKQIDIFLVDPKTNTDGTDVAYEDAIKILSYQHPVARPAIIKGKDGKLIKQLTDEDLQKIAKIREEGINISVVQPVADDTAAPSSDTFTLAELVKTQSKLLESQGEMLAAMKKEIDELKKDKDAKKDKADKAAK